MNELKRNGSGYFDPTAYIALKNISINERKPKQMECYRGEIWFVLKNGHDGTGTESGKPALVVSSDVNNHFLNYVSIVWLTKQTQNPQETHVEVQCKGSSAIALCENITTVSKDRLVDFVRKCTDEEMAAIDEALRYSLSLPNEKERAFDCPADCEGAENNLVKRKLAEAEKYLEEANKRIEALEGSIEYQNQLLQANSSDMAIRITAERDLYKSLYEKILERVIGA